MPRPCGGDLQPDAPTRQRDRLKYVAAGEEGNAGLIPSDDRVTEIRASQDAGFDTEAELKKLVTDFPAVALLEDLRDPHPATGVVRSKRSVRSGRRSVTVLEILAVGIGLILGDGFVGHCLRPVPQDRAAA